MNFSNVDARLSIAMRWKVVVNAVGVVAGGGAAVYMVKNGFLDLSRVALNVCTGARSVFKTATLAMQEKTISLLNRVFEKSKRSNEDVQEKIQKIEDDFQRRLQKANEVFEQEKQEIAKDFQQKQQENKEELQRRLQETDRIKQAVTQAALEDRIKTEIESEERNEADEFYIKEAGRLAKEQVEREFQEFCDRVFGRQNTMELAEESCSSVDPVTFKDMSDIERLVNSGLNPLCETHAEILLTPSGQTYDPTVFSSCDKIQSVWRTLAALIHPDKNPSQRDFANQAFMVAQQARDRLLQHCLPSH